VYAVIESGGKQVKVAVGDTVDVEQMPLRAGEMVELDRVLLVADGDQVTVGRPLVEGAKVRATVVDQVKGEKVIVFKYKPKIRYRRKTGHRQKYTRLRIDEIVV
jgi:large subunit ribosomal protein L21